MTDATLELIILDADSGQLKPARVEIIDGSGRNYVAGDALPVGGDCVDREEPAWPSLSIEALAGLTKTWETLSPTRPSFIAWAGLRYPCRG